MTIDDDINESYDSLSEAKEEIERLKGVIGAGNAYCKQLYDELCVHRNRAEMLQSIVDSMPVDYIKH